MDEERRWGWKNNEDAREDKEYNGNTLLRADTIGGCIGNIEVGATPCLTQPPL